MPYTQDVWNGLYEAVSRGDEESIESLTLCQCIHTEGYHGAGWAAEAASTDPEAKEKLISFLQQNATEWEGQLALFNIVADYNCKGGYFTDDEYHQLKTLLFDNWSQFLIELSENIVGNNAVISQIQNVISDDDYVEDGFFTEEQFEELKSCYEIGIDSILEKID